MVQQNTGKIPDQEHSIDAAMPLDALTMMLASHAAAVDCVKPALREIEMGAMLLADTLRRGYSVAYVGAGSSGLMALADCSELPGTFGIPASQIRIFMAGGVPMDGHMPGRTEDNRAAAPDVVQGLSESDLVIAISASGTTPYVCQVVEQARLAGIKVIGIANVANSPVLGNADLAICLPTPPEVLAGSTRLGAGTAQKVALNMMSTQAGVLLGHVHDGLMVNLHADNTKLRQRAAQIVSNLARTAPGAARAALAKADNDTKTAVLVALGCTVPEARDLLTNHKGHLRPCIKKVKLRQNA